MAFGQELKDFVSTFKTGYDMFDSKEEKDYKRQKRANDLRGEDDAHTWGTQDREFRNDKETYSRGQDSKQWDWKSDERDYSRGRDAVGDERWGQQFDYQQKRAGVADEQWATGAAGDEADRQLRRDDYKLRRAQESGASDTTRFGEFGIPDGSEGGEDATVQPMSYREDSAIPDDQLRQRARADGGGVEPVAGPAVAKRLVQDLSRDFGMPQDIAIGVVGQLAGESGGFKTLQEISPTVKGSRGGFGYAQWTGPRRRQFEAYAADQGLDPTSYAANYGFLRHELANTSEGAIMRQLKRARSAQEAGRIFTGSAESRSGFLRPGIPNQSGRDRWTNRVASLFGGGQGVRRAAVGGMIEEVPAPGFDEEDPLNDRDYEAEDMVEDAPVQVAAAEGAIPDAPVPTPRPDYSGGTDTQEEEPTNDPYEAGRRAVRDGLKRAIKDTGVDTQSAIDDPELENMRQNYLKGYGAAPSQMMRQALDKVDPDRKLPPSERNMRAVGTVYQFYMQDGQPEKAQAAAASMIQYYRTAANNFLSLSQAAAEKGDIDNAAKAAVAAYANIPNGRDMQITKGEDGNYEVTVTDIKTGKPVVKEVVDPKKFAELAMGFTPGTFDDEILNAAGAPAEKYDDPSLEDNQTVRDAAGAAFDEEGAVPEGYSKDDMAFAVADIAKVKQNGMAAADAAGIVTDMLAFDTSAEGDARFSPSFVAKPVRGNPNLVEVTTDKGDKVVMSKGGLNRIQGMRKDAMAREQEATKTAAEPGAITKAMPTLKKGLNAFADAFSAEGMRSAAESAKRRAAERDGATAPAPAEEPAGAIPDDGAVIMPAIRKGAAAVGDMISPAPGPGAALGTAGARARNEQGMTPEEEIQDLTQKREQILGMPSRGGIAGREKLAEIEARLQELQPEAIPTR